MLGNMSVNPTYKIGDRTILNKNLPRYHKDPFDRILISQAINRSLIIVSQNSMFNQYSVRLLTV